jgi:hypothetical protein
VRQAHFGKSSGDAKGLGDQPRKDRLTRRRRDRSRYCGGLYDPYAALKMTIPMSEHDVDRSAPNSGRATTMIHKAVLTRISPQNPASKMQPAKELRDHNVPLRDPTTESGEWPTELKLRRQWQRDFIEWYRANTDRFSIQLQLQKCTEKVLSVGF